MQCNSTLPINHVGRLDLLLGTPESPQGHCHKSRRTLMSLQEREITRCTIYQIKMKLNPSEHSRAIPSSTSYTTSGLTSFRQLQRFPETPVSSIGEHQFLHSNSRKAPSAPNDLDMRADFLDTTEEVCQLSTSNSRGGFPQQ